MPQNPLGVAFGQEPSLAFTPLQLDSSGNLKVVSATGGDAVTIADGANVSQGTTTDAAYTTGAGTMVAILKGIFGKFVNSLGALLVTMGGSSSVLNLTVAAAVKASPGRIARISVINAGSTGGAFILNDCATTGAATTANQIFTMAYNAAANVAGAVIVLDWPCAVGIVVSAVPSGGTPQLAISYT